MTYPTYHVLTAELPVIDELLYNRLLNVSRSALAYPALLAGYRDVYDALNDTVLRNFLDVFIHRAIPIGQPHSENLNWEDLKNSIVENILADLPDNQLEILAINGTPTFSTHLLPLLTDLIEQRRPTHCIAFLLAAYGHYLQAQTDDNDAPLAVGEPTLTEADWHKITDSETLSFLEITPFSSASLLALPQFTATYKLYRKQIAIYGIAFTLRQTMCRFWEGV